MNVSKAISSRFTTKMLGNSERPLPVQQDMASILPSLIATAGWAPFHRPAHACHRLGDDGAVVEPWRFYALDTPACRRLLNQLEDWPEKTGKILNMLAACDALVQVTWLPDPQSSKEAQLFEPTEANMEHIAAASAAVQNLLTVATAAGLRTYWSSGGVLRTDRLFELLAIPTNQILLGALFFFPTDPAGEVEILDGKQRAMRSPSERWTTWVA